MLNFKGELVAIYISPKAAADMQAVETVQAVPGFGLKGDRYFLKQGTFTKKKDPNRPDRQVTLIAEEALSLAAEAGVAVTAQQSRRNLVTRGVPLNDLIGAEFSVGSARLRGLDLCEPCMHLEKLTAPGVLNALIHRGGLRAEIIEEGTLKPGDPINLGS
ncbi:MAG: sulfurase [Elusimicrobia bacterium]|nr:MAG: sulfurase [Elusimicrobiota bacterium]